MPLGILEPKGVEHVPGSTRYYDDLDHSQVVAEGHTELKCDTSGKLPIILIPQPSDDPNDPLNWPLWRRDLITFLLCFAAILATSLGPILAANTIVISNLFGQTLTEVAVLTGYFLLGCGAAAIFFVPSARVWGKRHLFLLGMCIIVATSAWAGAVGSNYNSFVGARVIQGFGTAPFESLINAAVGDLYFVHQRGVRMAFTNLAVFGGAFCTPIVVGKITSVLGWAWTFNLVAIFMGATLPAVFLLCPETAYRRDSRLNTDTVGSNPVSEDAKLQPATEEPPSPPSGEVPVADQRRGFVLFPTSNAPQPIGNANTRKKSWVESLSLFDGRKTDERYWVLLLRPFPLLANPAFIWGCLVQGTMIGWTVFIGVMVAAVFIGPPYWWGEVKAGYTYTAPCIGAICGFLVSGVMADSIVRFMTKRNNGNYEPEFRLLLVIPMFIVASIGLFGFGLTASNVVSGEYVYQIPLVFFGFEVGGMVIGTVASALYIVDAYRGLAIEAFTLMIIFKNFFSFILTWFAYNWLIFGGIEKTLVTISGVQVVICFLTVPMYIYGKRLRAFYHRHDLLAMTGLQ